MLPRVKVVTTGGTIYMGSTGDQGLMPVETGQNLLTLVPSLQERASVKLEEFSNMPSEWISPSRWIQLRERLQADLADPETNGVVVIYGTDELEEIAFFLHLTIFTTKPLVLTGSMRSLLEAGSDAQLNVEDAVRVAASEKARNMGVLVVASGKVYSARDVRKTDTQAIAAFSGECGPLGIVDREGVFFYHRPLKKHTTSSEFASREFHILPKVAICCAYSGADGTLVDAAIRAGAQGLVIAALGAGNVNREMHAAIVRAIDNGIPVVISSQVPNGRVSPIYSYEGGGKSLAKAGCIFADNLTPLKAHVLLMLSLLITNDAAQIARIFAEY